MKLTHCPVYTALFFSLNFSAFAANDASPAFQPRIVQQWDSDWRFAKGDFATAMSRAFDDHSWRGVTLPHDWSTEEPLSSSYGSGNGFAAGGVGWYRKHFRLEESAREKLVTVDFDGIYDYSEIWVNGQFVGGRPYGYSSFQVQLSPYLRFGSNDNVLAVRVDHSRFADSRWYTGSGIYRNVRLTMTDNLHVAHWGTCITTPQITAKRALVQVETIVQNDSAESHSFTLRWEAVAPSGEIVATEEQRATAAPKTAATLKHSLKISQPLLWSPDAPLLYSLRCRVMEGSKIVDESENPFGIRSFIFDANNGFSLNGVAMKLKGVCLHHDAGPLGAAVPVPVLEHRLRLLKEIGVNAIRTSHNPPAPELLELCDRLGFLVMDEAFDEFTPAKNKWVEGRNVGEASRFGYAELFKIWSVRDIQDMVRRDRNHPCIVLWSIGNEVDYANDPFSHPVLGQEYHPGNPPAQELAQCAKPLIAAVKELDTTRPVTAALANVAMSDAVGLGELLDVAGYNYQEQRYADDHKSRPRRILYGSENRHDYRAWLAVRDNKYVAGQFLWTGIDYLGEAGTWPNHASPPGLFDLCGFKKPLAWFRQSLWSDKPMVYLCVRDSGTQDFRRRLPAEHWNCASNSTATVLCYANCDEVELTLNGRTLGTKKMADANNGTLAWQVPFEPGALKAFGRVKGKPVCDFELHTAGATARIELLPDKRTLETGGICQIEVRIADEKGVRVLGSDVEVALELIGPARLLGFGNGNVNDTASCSSNQHKTFQGRALAFLQSTSEPGNIVVKASAAGLEAASLRLSR